MKGLLIPDDFEARFYLKWLSQLPGVEILDLQKEYGIDKTFTLTSNPPQWYETVRWVSPTKRTGQTVTHEPGHYVGGEGH